MLSCNETGKSKQKLPSRNKFGWTGKQIYKVTNGSIRLLLFKPGSNYGPYNTSSKTLVVNSCS